MPVPGTKPKATPTRRRNAPTLEWTEVLDEPFAGAPRLPRDRRWSKRTREWWRSLSTMPHCVLWTASDWSFALDSAQLAAAFHEGNVRVAPELRQRERIMGTTADARRDLRIRYVQEVVEEVDEGKVAHLADVRRRLRGPDAG
jgi:hypothetical protein